MKKCLACPKWHAPGDEGVVTLGTLGVVCRAQLRRGAPYRSVLERHLQHASTRQLSGLCFPKDVAEDVRAVLYAINRRDLAKTVQVSGVVVHARHAILTPAPPTA